MRLISQKTALKFLLAGALFGLAPQLAMAVYVPDDLKQWVGWALHAHKDAGCARLEQSGQKHCVTYGNTTVDITPAKGATFKMTVQVDADEAQVALIGQTWAWPENITANGQPMGASAHRNMPSVRLNKGIYTITGSILWENTPASLQLPTTLAQASIRLDGKPLDMPQMRGNHLILQTQNQPIRDTPDAVAENTSKVQVFRLVTDSNPATITTNLRLTVTGSQREMTLPNFHLANTEATGYSGRLPVKRQNDGGYTVQVGAGVHTLTFTDRYTAGRLTELTMPALPWAEEVWAFNPIPELRLVEAAAETPLNPDQTDMPNHWRNFAAYLMRSGERIDFDTVREGAPTPPDNALNITRTLWLNQKGTQFTVKDTLGGTMNQTWRLDMAPVATLGRLNLNGQAQPLTEGANGRTGVEVRDQHLNLEAHSILPVSLMPLSGISLPAGAWNSRFNHAHAQIILPNAWRPVAVTGATKTSGTWLNQWNLYQFFFLLLTTALAYRFWGSAKWAGVTFIGLALTMHDHSSLLSQVLVVLVFSMMIAALPDGAKLTKWIGKFRGFVLLLLVLFAVPFTLLHLQNAVYPHLAKQALFSMPALNFGADFNNVKGVVAKSTFDADLAEHAPAPTPRRLHKEMRLMAAPEAATPMMADGLSGGIQAFMAQEEKPMRDAAMPTAPLTEFDPSTRVPTGPGLPEWRQESNTVTASWPDGVTEGASFRLWLLSPFGFRLLEILKVLFFGLLLAKLFKNTLDFGQLKGLKSKLTTGSAAILIGFGLFTAAPAHGADFPSDALLKELEQRLLQPPTCTPNCAFVEKAVLDARNNSIGLTLTFTAEESVLAPLPTVTPVAFPSNVTLNATTAFTFSHGSRPYVLLPAGRSVVNVRYHAGDYNNLTVDMQQDIGAFDSTLYGWNLGGLNNKNQPNSRRLSLSRTPDKTTQAPKKDEKLPTYKPLEFAGYANVTRQINLGNTWEVTTLISLEHGTPFTLDLPLLEGEKLLDGNYTQKEGKVRVNVSNRALHLRSEIAPTEELKLIAAENARYREVWQLNTSTKWHVEQTAGIAPIMHQQNGQWRPRWQPYAGDAVHLTIKRPSGVDGQELTIHNARLETVLRGQTKAHTLTLSLETTRPQTHTITLGDGVKLNEFFVNGRALSQAAAEEGQVLNVGIPLRHGMNDARLVWEETGASLMHITPPTINLNSPFVNLSQVISNVSDRWIVWSYGPAAGVYVKLWSVVLGMALLAAVMAKAMPTPLGFTGWLVLALGFTQADPVAFVLVAGWLFLLQWRATKAETLSNLKFNVTQIGIVLTSTFVIGAIFSVVKVGLLGTPEVYIEGNGSTPHMLQWFEDTGINTPEAAGIYTLPMWVFRGVMMAWALWTALWLMRTFKWAWQNFTAGGYWRKKEIE